MAPNPSKNSPERLKLAPSEQVTADCREQLKALETAVNNTEAPSVGRMLKYCETHKIDFPAWKSDPLEPEQMQGIDEVFSTTLGVENFSRFLTEGASPDDQRVAREAIHKIIVLMAARQERLRDSEVLLTQEKENVREGLATQTIGLYKESFRSDPLFTAVATGILMVAGYKLMGMTIAVGKDKKEVPVFKHAAVFGVLAWALNGLAGKLSPDGQTILERVLDKSDEEEALELGDFDRAGEDVDHEAIQAMLHIGNRIPFDTFLKGYERALQRGEAFIDMHWLAKRTAIPKKYKKYLHARYGEGYFKNMERMVGGETDPEKRGKILALREKYVNRPEGSYSFHRVFYEEYLNGVSDKETPTLRTARSKRKTGNPNGAEARSASAGAAAGAASSEADAEIADNTDSEDETPTESKSPADQTEEDWGDEGSAAETLRAHRKELASVGLDQLAVDMYTDQVHVMSTTLHYTREAHPVKGIDAVYRIDDPATGVRFLFEIGSGAKPTEQQEQREALERYLSTRMNQDARSQLGLTESPVWKMEGQKGYWGVENHPVPIENAAALGLSPTQAVTLKVDRLQDNTSILRYNGKEFTHLNMIAADVARKAVASNLQNQGAMGQMLKGTDVHVLDASNPDRIQTQVSGQPMEFQARGTDYVPVGAFALSESFLTTKKNQLEGDPRFTKVFEELTGSGPKLSRLRGALDLLSGTLPDATNYEWLELLDYKKEQILQGYADGLKSLQESGRFTAEAAQALYEDTLKAVETTLGPLPERLILEDSPQAALEAVEYYGYSTAYRQRYEQFKAAFDAQGFDFPGIKEKSNKIYQDIRFEVERIWYNHTRAFRNEPSLNAAQAKYCDVLQAGLLKQIKLLERKDVGWLQEIADSGIDEEEFSQALPGLKDLPRYHAWAHGEGIDVQHAAQLAAEARADLEKPVEKRFDANYVETRVNTLGNDANFKAYFESLAGQLPDKNWRSLVAYKKEEILQEHRQDLLRVMNLPGNDFNQKKTRADEKLQALVKATLPEIQTTLDAVRESYKRFTTDHTPELTDHERHELELRLERMTYHESYATLMLPARAYLKTFDYDGWPNDPIDGVNALLGLIHEKTAFMNGPRRPEDRDKDRAYFQAVLDKATDIARSAAASGGIVFSKIHPQEVPATLEIPDQETWVKANPDKITPVVPAAGTQKPDMRDTSNKAPESSEQISALRRLQDIYRTMWEERVYTDATHRQLQPDIDADTLQAIQDMINSKTLEFQNALLEDPSTEKDNLAAYQSLLEDAYDEVHDDWGPFR